MKFLNKLPYVCVFLVLGCNFMDLGEFGTPGLDNNDKCLSLNQEENLDIRTDCMIYQYVKDGIGCELRMSDWDDDGYFAAQCADKVKSAQLDCDDNNNKRYPGNTDDCDGIDNDCDYVIDNGSLLASAEQTVVENTGEITQASYTHGRDGQMGLLFNDITKSAFKNMVGPQSSLQTPQEIKYTYTIEQDKLEIPDVNNNYCSDGPSGSLPCDFADISADRIDDGNWIAAAVNTVRCADGQVRIGHISDGENFLILRGPKQHSNIFNGVDSEDKGQGECTGASRTDAPLGAAVVSIAALTPETRTHPQALVAWLADTVKRDKCGGSTVDVEVLGVWRESITNINSKWVNATNNGVQQVLGKTTGGGSPAILATVRNENFLSEGYFVAYGDESGGVSVYFIPVFADPPKYEYQTPTPTTTIRDTKPLDLTESGMASDSIDDEITGADHVSMALGKYDHENNMQKIGVVWQEGCGSSKVKIRFAIATFTEGMEDSPGTFKFTAPVLLNMQNGSNITSPPALAYSPTGFVSSEFQRDGVLASSEGAGGWIAAWVEKTGSNYEIKVNRVLEMDGKPIDVSLPQTIKQSESELGYLSLYKTNEETDDHTFGLLHYESNQNLIFNTGLLCIL